MSNLQSPSHTALIQAYLAAHFAGQPAAVFCVPDDGHDRMERIAKMLNMADLLPLAVGQVYIHQMPLDACLRFVNGLDEDAFGYVFAWARTSPPRTPSRRGPLDSTRAGAYIG